MCRVIGPQGESDLCVLSTETTEEADSLSLWWGLAGSRAHRPVSQAGAKLVDRVEGLTASWPFPIPQLG